MKKIFLCLIVSAVVLLADFTRDGVIVTDSTTGLMWQDDANASANATTWQGAIDRCEALSLGAYNDWRLPNFNELYFIADHSRVDPAIDPTFINVILSYYWSSTTYVATPSGAWTVYFSDGGDSLGAKTNGYYVRCVRGGQ